MRRLAAALVVPALLISACSGSATSSTPSDRPVVVASFAPLADIARQVGGSDVSVVDLTPSGVEPHDLELTAQQVGQIADADVVVSIPGFQSAVDEAIAQQASDRSVDATTGVDLIAGDPHVWLDPANMAVIATSVATALGAADPAHATDYDARAAAYAAAMTALSTDMAAGLAQCASTDLVVSHEAFAYLARAFGLTQIGISGISPDAEPSPARIAEVARLVTDKGVSTVYFEPLVDPKIAQTVADESGASVAELDPIENLADGSTYEDVMRANLKTLQEGQQCR